MKAKDFLKSLQREQGLLAHYRLAYEAFDICLFVHAQCHFPNVNFDQLHRSKILVLRQPHFDLCLVTSLMDNLEKVSQRRTRNGIACAPWKSYFQGCGTTE